MSKHVKNFCECISVYTYISITMPVIEMCHQGETLPLHSVTPFPKTLHLVTATWTMTFTRMHINFICRLEIPNNSKKLFAKITNYFINYIFNW